MHPEFSKVDIYLWWWHIVTMSANYVLWGVMQWYTLLRIDRLWRQFSFGSKHFIFWIRQYNENVLRPRRKYWSGLDLGLFCWTNNRRWHWSSPRICDSLELVSVTVWEPHLWQFATELQLKSVKVWDWFSPICCSLEQIFISHLGQSVCTLCYNTSYIAQSRSIAFEQKKKK